MRIESDVLMLLLLRGRVVVDVANDVDDGRRRGLLVHIGDVGNRLMMWLHQYLLLQRLLLQLHLMVAHRSRVVVARVR